MTQPNQRWRDRADSFRPAGEPINTRDYEVATIADDATAKRFVCAHHYSGSFPAAVQRFGLYTRDNLVGVAVFSVPMTDAVITNVLPCPPREAPELGRFVLLDSVPGNGESFFLARCFDLLRRIGYAGAVSFSDPVPRTRLDGTRVFAGHVGTIYQATNARYVGRGQPRTLQLLPDGSVLSARTISKIRRGPTEQGFDYAVRQLTRWGADAPGRDHVAWLKRWMLRLCRPLRHGGNHKYVWALDRRLPILRTAQPYPKLLPPLFAA